MQFNDLGRQLHHPRTESIQQRVKSPNAILPTIMHVAELQPHPDRMSRVRSSKREIAP